jgi:hypothetical protein
MLGGQGEAYSSADPVRDERFVDVFPVRRPSIDFGATGPGPFGNRWLLDGRTATPLLDADLRFFGAMMIGSGFIFFLTIWKLEVYRPLIYVLASAVAVGAAARIYARITYGNPGTAGTIPVVIEVLLPIFLVVLSYLDGKDATKATK